MWEIQPVNASSKMAAGGKDDSEDVFHTQNRNYKTLFCATDSGPPERARK